MDTKKQQKNAPHQNPAKTPGHKTTEPTTPSHPKGAPQKKTSSNW